MRLMQVLFALVLLSASAIPAAAETLSETAFRDEFVRRAQAAAPGVQFKVLDPLGLERLSASGASEGRIHLDNVYSEYRGAPAALGEILDRFIRVLIVSNPAKDEVTKDRLVPLVRPKALLRQLEEMKSSSDGNGYLIIYKPFAGDLIQVLAVDSEETLRYAKPDDLKILGLSIEQGWQAAATNWKTRATDVDIGPVEGLRMQVASSKSGLITSFLTDFSLCTRQATRDLGGVYVLLADRNVFIFAAHNDKPALADFWRFAKVQLAAEDAYSRTPLLCRNGQWSVSNR